MTSQLNPFEFLGLDLKSSLSDLKKRYYELSLICHPDRGGNKDDMITLHNCYLYVKKHLENVDPNDISETYLRLEKEFEIFCRHQQEQQLPSFHQIYQENNDFIQQFNEYFENSLKINQTDDPTNISNYDQPFKDGYQDLMETSDYHHQDVSNFKLKDCKYFETDSQIPIQNNIQQPIIIYQEPTSLPDNYGSFQHLNNNKINDFSYDSQQLNMTDYQKAFNDYHQNQDYYQNLGISYEHYQQVLINSEKDLESLMKQRQEAYQQMIN